ncbi:universal stress protein [Arcobacter sp. FWKO B]|uniref:universal stress protein n=1 Tax=Arcobacter sp. FWKO B TaxID=2593672 RepID=UPI0018A5F198|nr:universal stress protein [Arcobacter sp. FWKO B]QOG12379.1 universal stress protein [Arcobacter sp. FWKO B]
MESKENFILTCIDGSVLGEAVCDYGCWIAKYTGAPLKLLNIVEHNNKCDNPDLSGSIGLGAKDDLLEDLATCEESRSKLQIQKNKEALNASKQRALDKGIENIIVSQRHGEFDETLAEIEDDIRVLILGIRGENGKKVGSTVQDIIRSLRKPILLVNQDFLEPKKVLLAYDGSKSALKALHMIETSPVFKNIECHVVNVSSNYDSSSKMLEFAKMTLDKVNIKNEVVTLNGDPLSELLKYQEENSIDMIAMGAFSHNRIRDALFGSFTAKMLENTKKPLLLLR